jgi:hypothetical protein
MEAQRAQAPPWYLPSGRDAIEVAVDNIDLPALMIPIYQKYVSQEDAPWLIRLTATPQVAARGESLRRLANEETERSRAHHVGHEPPPITRNWKRTRHI